MRIFFIRVYLSLISWTAVAFKVAETFQIISFFFPNFFIAYSFGVLPSFPTCFSSTPLKSKKSVAWKILSKSLHSEKLQKRKCNWLAPLFVVWFETSAPNCSNSSRAIIGFSRQHAKCLNIRVSYTKHLRKSQLCVVEERPDEVPESHSSPEQRLFLGLFLLSKSGYIGVTLALNPCAPAFQNLGQFRLWR